MRIAQVVQCLEIGGLERMAVDLAVGLKAAGHEAFVYCVYGAGPLAKVAEAGGVPVRDFQKKPGLSPLCFLRILRQLREDRIDLVHTHNTVIHHYGAVARLIGIPVVNTEHGMGKLSLGSRQMRIFGATMPLTSAVVFVAEEPKRLLWDAGGFPAAKGYVILNGIPTRTLAAHPARPGGSPPRMRFGTVGRLVPVKDHATLLRAFARVASANAGAELHIVGYGVLEGETRQLAHELGLGDRFRLLPGDSNIPLFLSGLDVFMMSSRTEGLPLCVLEAMAAGLPLVSTRVGGIPEVAPEGEVAWYAPAGDPEALASAMEMASHSNDLTARGRRAAQLVDERFSMDTMLRAYEELYRKLVG